MIGKLKAFLQNFKKEKQHPMFCVQHGGSPKCEEINKKYNFTCPKCKE